MENVDIVLQKNGDLRAEVTVTISLYNYEDYIISALESVKSQTLDTLDLVIVDDCSHDNSLEIVRNWLTEYGNRFNNYLFIKHTANQGLGATRNTAFKYAKSEYVFVLDADNLLYPRCIQMLLLAIKNSQASFSYSYLETFGEQSSIINLVAWDPSKLQFGNEIDAMVLMRKAVWEKVGGYSEDMPVSGWEDFDLWFKVAETQGWAVHAPEILARYRVHESSMLHATTNPNYRKLWKYLRSNHPTLFS